MSTGGIDLRLVAKDSLMRRKRDFYFGPEALSTTKIVNTVDPSGLSGNGAALTLQTNVSSLLLNHARRPTLTLTDASGGSGGLALTVRLVMARWGVQFQEDVTVTCTDGSATTSKFNNVCDEIISATLVGGFSTAAAGDALAVGIDGTSFGLDFPIDNIADVISIINNSTNTEASPTAISSTTVVAGAPSGGSFAGGSYIKGLTLATTDRWTVQYLSSLRWDATGTVGVFR